jgi:ATP-binding cassette subfamily B protein
LINLLLSGVAGFYTPLLIEDFYQSINSDESFKIAAFYLVLLLVAEYVNRFLFQISTHRYIQLLLGEIRLQSYGVWLNAPFKKNLKNKKDFPMGEVLARLMNDTDAVRDVVGSGSFAIFIDIIFVSSCLVSFLQMNSATGLTLFIAEVLACFLLVKGSKFMAKIFMDVRRLTGQMARVVTDLTSGLKELYFSPNHQYASKRGEKIFEEFLG